MENLSNIMEFELFQLSGRSVTVATLAIAGLILAGTYLVSFLLRKTIERWFGPKDRHQQGAQKAVLRLMHYVILLVGLGLAMETIGISFTTLLATGAIFAVGIGFALQNVVQNFVSGIILLFERSIKPNDVLEIEGRIVRVMSMGIRSTVAKTLDEEELIIPNSILAGNTVKNYTMGDSIHRLRAPVGVTYDSDMAQVASVLDQAARQLSWTVPGREPMVLMTGFGDNSVNFEVSVWIDNPWRRNRRLSELNTAIWWALQEAKVVIAFPQVDVHFDPPVTESLRLISSSPDRAATSG
jgi:small-conductance mechanosensitive channel